MKIKKGVRLSWRCLQEDSGMKWDDIVFIPPGFDVSTTPPQQSGDGISS